MDDTESRPSANGDLRLLDCTLRDGGYYANWDFPLPVVQDYLDSMSQAGINLIEIGFRTRMVGGYKGPTAFSRENFLSLLNIQPSISLGVMLNSAELVGASAPEAIIDDIFLPAASSRVSFVRLATQVGEIAYAKQAAERLRELGYATALNIMQFTEVDIEELAVHITEIQEDQFDVVYVADSLGKALPKDVSEVVSRLKQSWGGAIGFHGHDNRGLALANSLAASDAGATWIDGTVSGIGRGAGNTRIDLLLGQLGTSEHPYRDTTRLENLVNRYFAPLQSEKGWGPNIHYARGAIGGIHPTFIQELLDNATYSSLEINAAIRLLRETNSTRFDKEQLESIDLWLNQAQSPKSSWNQKDFFEQKSVMFLGGGETIIKHARVLAQLAQTPEMVVVVANLGHEFPADNVDAHIACNRLRLIADSGEYVTKTAKLIAPEALLPLESKKQLVSMGRLLDLGLSIEPDVFNGEKGLITLPKPSVLAFGLLAALSGGAKNIYLAGFDGYGEGDSRHKPEQQMLDQILRRGYPSSVSAITPTSLDLPQTSLYTL